MSGTIVRSLPDGRVVWRTDSRAEKLPTEAGECLRLGPGNERDGADGEFKAAEGNGAFRMLQGLALAPRPNQPGEGIHFGGGQGAIEGEVKLHAVDPKRMGRERFGLEPRAAKNSAVLWITSRTVTRASQSGKAGGEKAKPCRRIGCVCRRALRPASEVHPEGGDQPEIIG